MPFSGYIAEIPLGGTGGLNGSTNPTQVLPTELIRAENIAYEGDVIRKEGGAVKYNATSVPGGGTILGGYDFWTDSLTQRQVIYTSAGYLLKDSGDGLFPTTLATGLQTNVTPVFVEGGQEAINSPRKLFTFAENQSVKVLSGDGTTVTNIASPAADWTTAQPTCGCISEGRLWAASNHRVYYSTASNHEDFSTTGGADPAGQMPIFSGVGERIVQLVPFKGFIVVFKKPRGIFVIDTRDTLFVNWKALEQNTSIGVPSAHAAVRTDDDIMFMDATGSIQLLNGIDNDNFSGINISQSHSMNPYIQSHVNTHNLDHIKSIYYPAKREVHFAVPQTGSTVNNARLVVDLNHINVPTAINPSQVAPRFRWSPRDTCESMWLRRDNYNISRPVVGDDAGTIWMLDQEARAKNNAAFLSAFQTSHLDMSWLDPELSAKRKIATALEIVATPQQGVELSCDIYFDGRYTQTVVFSLNPSGVPLGEFVLGTDVLGSNDILIVRRKRVTCSGRRVSFLFYNNRIGEDFAIGRAYFYFRVGDEDLRNSN